MYGLLRLASKSQGLECAQGLDNVQRLLRKEHNLARFARQRLSRTRLFSEDRKFGQACTRGYSGRAPRVAIRITGARISQAKLKELVPLFQEHSIDPDLLLEGQRNIRQYLVENGYFGATVTYEVASGATEKVVTYSINRGSLHRFISLQIAGNHYFTTATIRERLYIEPATFPRFPLGRFSEDYLQADLQAIRILYQANGFRDVAVKSVTRDDYSNKANRLGVLIAIQEGPQWFISKIEIKGASLNDQAVFRPRLTSLPGQPFSGTSIAADRETLLNFYYDRGYLNASFEYQITPASNAHTLELAYLLHPGEQRFVRDVLISGLQTTQPRLVTERMELRSGEPLSLAQEINTQRRLYDLGIFRSREYSAAGPSRRRRTEECLVRHRRGQALFAKPGSGRADCSHWGWSYFTR